MSLRVMRGMAVGMDGMVSLQTKHIQFRSRRATLAFGAELRLVPG